jgi:hypothetical protein
MQHPPPENSEVERPPLYMRESRDAAVKNVNEQRLKLYLGEDVSYLVENQVYVTLT